MPPARQRARRLTYLSLLTCAFAFFNGRARDRLSADGVRHRCKEMGVKPSMGSVGDAYDNAMAESFFASLECELIDRRTWRTKTEARMALFTYIEGWYNPRRRHSALGYLSPANFETNHQDNANRRAVEHGLPAVGVCVAGATPPVDNPATCLIEPD